MDVAAAYSEVSEATKAEMEEAWQILLAHKNPAGFVRGPTRFLVHRDRTPAQARTLLLAMERAGWIVLSKGGFYSASLTRRALIPCIPATEEPPVHETLASPTAPEEDDPQEKPLTQEEIVAARYGALFQQLIQCSFQAALDGYVFFETLRREAWRLGHEPNEALTTLLQGEHCSLWVIRPDGLKEATAPPSNGETSDLLVCIERIPVPRPSKKVKEHGEGGLLEMLERSARSHSYEPPLRVNGAPRSHGEKALPPWHPFCGWVFPESADTKEGVVAPTTQSVGVPVLSRATRPNITPSSTTPPVPPASKRKKTRVRPEHENQTLHRACLDALRAAMKEDRLVYAYMALLNKVFTQHEVVGDAARRAVIQQLIDDGFLERRGRSSVRVLDGAPPPEPTHTVETPPPDLLEVAYQTLLRKKSRIRGDDGYFFTTEPKRALGLYPPYLGGVAAETALIEMEIRGWIRRVQTGASFYAVLLRSL